MTSKGEIEYDPDKSGKIFTRFKTKAMSNILPNSTNSKSGWGTDNYYFYEIKNIDGKEFFIQFVVSSKNIPVDLRDICNRINDFFPSRQQKANWLWRTHFSTRHAKTDEDLTEEKIYEQLNKRFEEIKMFELKIALLISSGPSDEVE